jgi:hypothetical protein
VTYFSLYDLVIPSYFGVVVGFLVAEQAISINADSMMTTAILATEKAFL